MSNIIYEKFDDIGVVKVNRPQVRNALNRAVLQELQYFLDVTAKQDRLKAVILTGAGDKAFISGADIKEMQSMNDEELHSFWFLGRVVADSLETSPFLTMAAVQGYALGGGLEMALGCDFIYSDSTALFGFPEVKLGVIPCFGGIQRLTRAIGSRLSKELIMSGRTVSAETAQSIGIVNQVFSGENLIAACLKTAKEITSHSITAIKEAKNAINCGERLSLNEAIVMETAMCKTCFSTPERKEAMNAFLHPKRKLGAT